MFKSMALKPSVSEKTYGLSQASNTFVFLVPLSANKDSVKKAVEAQFEVGVVSVRTTNVTGKVKRTYRRGGRFVKGQRNSQKKAYVTLKAGDSLPIFAALADEPEVEEKNSKDKKDKKDKKEKK